MAEEPQAPAAPDAFGPRRKHTGSLRCPHCRSIGIVRSSERVTDQHRVMHYFCTNAFCGHTWRASLSYEYGISPSAIPNPRVDLPMRPMPRQQVLESMRERDANQPDMFDTGGSPGI